MAHEQDLIIGIGSATPAFVANGTIGTVLTANGAGVAPTFQAASASGAVTTVTGNSGGALSPSAGNLNILGATVASGTSPLVTSGSGSTLTINAQRSQALSSADSTKVGLSNFDSSAFSVDANGFVTLTGTPRAAFLVLINASQNVTANGSAFNFPFDSINYDLGSNITTPGGVYTFTAPVSGVYHFSLGVFMSGLVAQTGCTFSLIIAGSSFLFGQMAPIVSAAGGQVSTAFSTDVSMTVGQTAIVQGTIFGGGTVTMQGIAGSSIFNTWSGHKIS